MEARAMGSSYKNRLLMALSPGDRALLSLKFVAADMPVYFPFEVPNEPIERVYFMEAGIASVVGVGKGNKTRIEIGLIGPEGVSGAAVILGGNSSPHET